MQKKLAIFAIVLVFILGALAGAWLRGLRPVPVPEPDFKRDTVWMTDTVKLPAPKPKLVHVIDSVLIPIRDTLHLHDTAYIAVPISQTYYNEKEYEAWVSGFRAQLDSIHVVQNTAIVEVPVYKTVKKRRGLGAQVGVTYLPNTGVTPYVGLGLCYNLLTF